MYTRPLKLRLRANSYAASEAARIRTDEDIDALTDAQAKLERIGVDGAASDQALADLAFHQIISDATGSRLLQTIMAQVLAFTVSVRSNYTYPAEHAKTAIDQHHGILQALQNQDQDQAEQLMREHVECSKQLALTHFDDSYHVIVP